MKRLIFLVGLAIVSCADTNERDEILFTVRLKNNSNEEIQIKGYSSPSNIPEFDFTISPFNLGGEISYRAEAFLGYVNGYDSITFKFPNEKGYICSIRVSNSQPKLCFLNEKSPFGNDPNNPPFNEIGNNIYEFEITQEDYENAFELPEN